MKKILWFLLKLLPTLVIGSCILTDLRDTAWVRGATGDGTPFFLALATATGFTFWTYSVIWRPLAPRLPE